MKIKQILDMKLHDEFNVHDDEESFLLLISKINLSHSNYILITDFEGNTKIYDCSYIQFFKESFIENVISDFNLTITE